MANGNCSIGSRGFILQLSSDPGFVALVKEDLKPWSPVHERTPSQEKLWLRRMRAYVPLLLKGLKSKNGCIQLEAISYLARLKDPRAVEPFYQLIQKYPLETGVARAALSDLADIYNDRDRKSVV